MAATVEIFRSAISLETGINASSIDVNTPFSELEIDPMTGVAILEYVQEKTGIELPVSLFRDCNNISDIQKILGNLTISKPIVQASFDETQQRVGQYAEEAGVADFWSTAYPPQRRLVLAYIYEAFAKLGSPLDKIAPGATVSAPKGILPRHSKVINTILQEILVDGGILERTSSGKVVRTATPIDKTPSAALYEKLEKDFPLHAKTHQLLNITAPQFAECLTGAADPIKLLFGTPYSRNLLDEFYTNAPMSIAASKHLSALFRQVFTAPKFAGQRIEILEIGAGFGGTTTFILNMLVEAKIPFKYTFTDISPSFFGAAKKRYANLPIPADSIEYAVLDIEKEPAEKFVGRYHAVLSTNCIHATKNLVVSGTNARKLLRPGGFFNLIEFTTRLYWLDLVFGLLDGWWLFEDGRTHCIGTEAIWKKSLQAAGFGDVLWTEPSGNNERPNPQVIVGCTE